jgi:potassium-transporting ATPase KdpC subunit
MRRQLQAALGMLLLFTVITGLAYPLAVTGVAQALFADQADGSLLERDGEVVGSELVGQPFTEPIYFHPRPSAVRYDGTLSSGSNLGPTNPELLKAIARRAEAYRQENGLGPDAQVPVDAVTASGSGLDPDISVANARLQALRVADARGLPIADVLDLIGQHTDDRTFGFLGEPRVNVLELNLALDAQE